MADDARPRAIESKNEEFGQREETFSLQTFSIYSHTFKRLSSLPSS